MHHGSGWKCILLFAFAMASCVACAPQPSPRVAHPGMSQVGIVERAFDDALAALAIPAALQGIDLEALTVRKLDTRGPTVAAVTVVGGRLTVMYDRAFLEVLAGRFGYDAIVGVFAHELGHVLNALAGIDDSELAADAWAGCALGIRLGDVSGFANLLASFPAGGDHPPAPERALAATEGYGVCARMMWE